MSGGKPKTPKPVVARRPAQSDDALRRGSRIWGSNILSDLANGSGLKIKLGT